MKDNELQIMLASSTLAMVLGVAVHAFTTRNRIPRQMPLPKLSTIDPEQLRLGIKEELEHTRNPAVARVIALHHLRLIKDYYTRLRKMEREAGITD
jgi:hypothetical protein